MVQLDEGWDLETDMGVLWFIESESVVYHGWWWDNQKLKGC